MRISREIWLTLICRFMVMQKSVMKYMTRMGQKTGMLKKSKKVHTNAMTVAFVAEYQNLNSVPETECRL
jgi:type I site-specific restriction-modification system R (restriction) subunit